MRQESIEFKIHFLVEYVVRIESTKADQMNSFANFCGMRQMIAPAPVEMNQSDQSFGFGDDCFTPLPNQSLPQFRISLLQSFR